MLTDKQFNEKISKLKNKEALHRELSRKYHEEIDRLLNERAKATIENYVGSYVNSGNNYMKVETQEIKKYGFYIYGTGFCDLGNGFCEIKHICFMYDNRMQFSKLKKITESEYRGKYYEILDRTQKNIIDI